MNYFIPWGYYIPLETVRMDWNSQTKVVRYYTEAYPVWLLALGGSIAGFLASSKDWGLFCPYSLMIMGMNSNRTEDGMTGQMGGFFLSCLLFLGLFLWIANRILTKRDVIS